jgi:hypothetical protein
MLPFFLLLILLIFSSTATATIITIPNDYSIIQDGINASSTEDTVLVEPGIYQENLDFNGHLITLGSLYLTTNDTSFIALTVIDGDSSGSVVTFQNDEDSTAKIIGFTIRNGHNRYGGGINCLNSNPSIHRNIIRDNSATFGGGVYCGLHSRPIISNNTILCNRVSNPTSSLGSGGGVYCEGSHPAISQCLIAENWANHTGGGISCSNASPTIERCIIEGNTARIFGGGIGNVDSNPIITNCSIIDNQSGDDGGGIFNMGSNSYIDSCIIINNSAIEWGGGICAGWDSYPLIRNCTIVENSSGDGGGLYCYDSHVIVSNSSFRRNRAEGGGGVYTHNDGGAVFLGYNAVSSLILTRCVLSRNDARRHAGAIYSSNNCSVTVTNCTITGNNANRLAGGIWCSNSNLTLMNTIIENNHGNGGIYFSGTNNTSIRFGDCYQNTGGNFSGNSPAGLGILVNININNDSCDIFRNIFEDPMFVNPASGDYHLQAGSPCIDAGNPQSILDPDSTIADMGAYYFDHEEWLTNNNDLVYPSGFHLFPNYPNPFNSSTNITYYMPHSGNVSIHLFNLLGQKVTTIVEGWNQAGFNRITFNDSKLSSGTYFYILTTGEDNASGKMILLK